MINLRLAKQKAKKLAAEMPTAERPRYPYGTSLSLGTEALSKLGQGVDDYSMSDTVTVHGKAKVTSLSKHENEGEGRARQTVDLQITHIEINKGNTLRELRKKGNPCLKSSRK